MAKRILVPLDHETEYEVILPLVGDLARGSGATVRLLHVAPVPENVVTTQGRVVSYSDQEMSRLEHEWLASLQVSEPLFVGVTVERTVRFGDVDGRDRAGDPGVRGGPGRRHDDLPEQRQARAPRQCRGAGDAAREAAGAAPARGARMSRAVAALALLLIGAAPGPAVAGGATDALRPAIDHVRRILDDPALKGPARTPERRAALRGVLEGVIDFPEASRRALAVHWRDRTDAERAEFVALFKDLVTYSYIVKIEPYAGEPVVFTGESEHDGMTTVLTRIQTRQGTIPVDYRMHVRDGRWLVYDVLVEGVSLVGNYRAQFNSIIQTSSFAELVRRMKVRLTELAAASPA